MAFIVAIDGPAGTGKGTVTKILAKRNGFIYIDTGAMYRCVTLECINRGILPNETKKINEVLENIDIKLMPDSVVFLNGKDVSEEIRTPNVDKFVAKFAELKEVRDKLTPIQQAMGKNADVIMEGRDIGTVVFPNADVKIFLDCALEERANRRYKQNLEKGIEQSYQEVLKAIVERHRLETEREIAPLTKTEDAILVDSTDMTIEEVVNTIEEVIRRKNND
ncbi:MAG: (d)CMP kinase [Clostridia bacterium]|jgi:cytidylate kinase|nr:(d)CMP kinase [Clostridia bacterium]